MKPLAVGCYWNSIWSKNHRFESPFRSLRYNGSLVLFFIHQHSDFDPPTIGYNHSWTLGWFGVKLWYYYRDVRFFYWTGKNPDHRPKSLCIQRSCFILFLPFLWLYLTIIKWLPFPFWRCVHCSCSCVLCSILRHVTCFCIGIRYWALSIVLWVFLYVRF